jgi:hypothetical protein
MSELHNAECITGAECAPSSESSTISWGQNNVVTRTSLKAPILHCPKASLTLLRLPDEVRNILCERCILVEASKVRIIRYNAHPLRRLRRYGNSNFENSFWSFTQTSRQIRLEVLPSMLKNRRVRTPPATIDEYLDVFRSVDL